MRPGCGILPSAALEHTPLVCELLACCNSVPGQNNQWSAMKRLGRATIGVALIAGGALAAFIHARYSEGPNLCVGVMARLMAAKEENTSPRMFMRRQADLLEINGATDEKLNEVWQKWITELYAQNHSPAEAAQWLEDFRKQWNCI
jgi:hypothetical protein